jgi:hypothetical protein
VYAILIAEKSYLFYEAPYIMIIGVDPEIEIRKGATS